MFGYGTPIGSHFSPLHPAYVDLADYYAYDPGKANALLAESGHANGLTLALKLPPQPHARRSSDDSRVGQECVSTGRSRCTPSHENKKTEKDKGLKVHDK